MVDKHRDAPKETYCGKDGTIRTVRHIALVSDGDASDKDQQLHQALYRISFPPASEGE